MSRQRSDLPASGAELASQWGWYVGLGVVMLGLSAFVFTNIAATTLVTTWLIGALLVAGGAVHVIQAMFNRRQSRFIYNLLSGALHIVAGVFIMREPLQGSMVITIFVMLALAASGVMRIAIAFAHRHIAGWWLVLVGGVVSIAVGVLLLASLPWSGLWVLGMLIGIELAVQGFSWLAFGIILNRVRTLA